VLALLFVDGGGHLLPFIVGGVVVRLLPVHALPFKKCSPTMDVQLTKKVHQSGASSSSTGRKADSGGGRSIAHWGVVFGERGGRARV